MNKFDVEVKISFTASVNDIEAKNENHAKEIAKAKLDDFYRLNSLGCPHLPISVDMDYEVWEYED